MSERIPYHFQPGIYKENKVHEAGEVDGAEIRGELNGLSSVELMRRAIQELRIHAAQLGFTDFRLILDLDPESESAVLERLYESYQSLSPEERARDGEFAGPGGP